ncbi:MAG: SGNH/GDSL hydrolase family protein [Pseudomonadota bacterium]
MADMKKQHGFGARLAFAVIVIFLAAALIEAAARIIFPSRDAIKTIMKMDARRDLNEYEMPDPRYPYINWVLRPSFSRTFKEAIEAKQREGRALGAANLEKLAADLGVGEDEVVYRINSDGYKGPEIDKAHSKTRILTIGDSCTFGSLVDKHSYPRVLERELLALGKNVEVINAGVEGYHPKNVLLRMDELKALKPDIATIYIGWNALDGEPATGLERSLYSVRLAKSALRKIFHFFDSPQKAALFEYSQPRHPDASAPDVKSLDGYSPLFMKDVEKIAEELRSIGCKVVFVTLPSLYVMWEVPSETAMKVGSLPPYTDNPYVWAKVVEQYNIDIRKLAQEDGLAVVDLERWSRTALVPRDAYFGDSVHLDDRGQEMIGEYMAEEISPLLPK